MALYVNSEQVDEKEIEDEVARLRPHYNRLVAQGEESEDQEKQLHEWSRENVIERVLLRQAAFCDPAEVPADQVDKFYHELADRYGGVEKFRERFGADDAKEKEIKEDVARRMRVEWFIDKIASQAAPLTDAEIEAYYQANLEKFTIPEMVRASHIVRHPEPDVAPEQMRADMEKLLKQLRGGAEFAELARTQSDCPANGGDLGWFPRGHMVERFDDVVFAMQPGEISDVFETEFGFHIATVADKAPARPRPLEDVRESLVKELAEQSRQKAIEDFVDVERARSVIEDKE
ncbi:MAG: peptidylprolyl isomerase [Candidatus Sumerlaeota bacterium]|nr:peptidylprolyl isomerase [Candidatus Sumerlaeota bacterium]